jgi:hypothetical protein
MAYLWHLWPGRGWPSTSDEETALLRQWRHQAGGRAGQVRRDALIVILGGLRCGSGAADLARVAPTLDPADLVASYTHLDRRRDEAAEHFTRMCAPTSEASFRRHARGAALLCPGPVGLLRRTLRTSGLDGVRAAGVRVMARATQVTREIDEVVAQLPYADNPVEVGRLLFDPYTPGLWGDPYFAARRVGELTPVRVRMLLGEEPDSDLIFTDVHDIGRHDEDDVGEADAGRGAGSSSGHESGRVSDTTA